MTREQVLKLFPEATEEQITNLLNQSNAELEKEKTKAKAYKADADKAKELPICSVYGEVVTDYEAMGQCENQMSFADFGIFDKERPLLKTTGCQRTGCVLCGFGCHLEKESRFELLKQTHPKFHNLLYILKNNGVTYAEAIDWVNEHGGFNIKY